MTAAALPWSPACMDEAERAEWDAANRRINNTRAVARRADRPCTDCTLGFAADMRALGRCNGTPGGVEEEEDMDDKATIAREMSPEQREAARERMLHARAVGVAKKAASGASVS